MKTGETEVIPTKPAEPEGSLEETEVVPASADGLQTSTHQSSGAAGDSGHVDPSDLLPKDMDTEFGNEAAVQNNLENVNMLTAGYHSGVNTVGSSLRNANLQLRSEPANPRQAVGPFLNSTIEPDQFRRALEIGSA